MDELICTRCGCQYEEPPIRYERADNGIVYRVFSDICRCGGQLVEAVRCETCGTIIPESEKEIGDQGEALCSFCKEEEENALCELVKSAQTRV